jgi:orotate phosphoribosyltransferase
MEESLDPILDALFTTEAIQVCPADAPFWYTSGKFGPYYVNTHYLIGGKKTADEALSVIDSAVSSKLQCPKRLGDLFQRAEHESPTYRASILALVEAVRALHGKTPFDAISGGERRDWYFSLQVARHMGLPHVSLFKDLSAVLTDSADANDARLLHPGDLRGKRVLHIVDIVTEASSYIRAWIPALKGLDAVFEDTLSVVDRDQGGESVLAAQKIRLHSLAVIHPELFHGAFRQGWIDSAQNDMVQRFMADPDGFMHDFMARHPDFLQRTLAAGGKNAEKARLAMEKHYV